MNNNTLNKAYDRYFQSVSENAKNKFELALWSAWGRGAFILDKALSAIPGYEFIPDNLDKAKNLVSLFIQPMISIWHDNWEKQEWHSSEEMMKARRVAFENVQTFLHIQSPNITAIHFILDIELTYFLNNLRKSTAYYVGMFYQRYRECMTGENIVEWYNLKVPIDDWRDFLNRCHKNRFKDLDGNSPVATSASICDASARMFQEFKRLYEQR